jgi:prepilin-type N-terminal cleavage/methylation domain-containing protein
MRYQIRHYGFTIVELLVVTVVIAVLASITVVTYNGVQDRAINTQTLLAVNQWEKILRTYQQLNPSTAAGGLPVSDYNCLASASSNFPASTGLSAGECMHGYPSFPNFSVVYSSALTTDLQGVLGSTVTLPSGYLRPVSGVIGTTQIYAQGIRYISLAIQYYLKGYNTSCGKGAPVTTSNVGDTLTFCYISLS